MFGEPSKARNTESILQCHLSMVSHAPGQWAGLFHRSPLTALHALTLTAGAGEPERHQRQLSHLPASL